MLSYSRILDNFCVIIPCFQQSKVELGILVLLDRKLVFDFFRVDFVFVHLIRKGLSEVVQDLLELRFFFLDHLHFLDALLQFFN